VRPFVGSMSELSPFGVNLKPRVGADESCGIIVYAIGEERHLSKPTFVVREAVFRANHVDESGVQHFTGVNDHVMRVLALPKGWMIYDDDLVIGNADQTIMLFIKPFMTVEIGKHVGCSEQQIADVLGDGIAWKGALDDVYGTKEDFVCPALGVTDGACQLWQAEDFASSGLRFLAYRCKYYVVGLPDSNISTTKECDITEVSDPLNDSKPIEILRLRSHGKNECVRLPYNMTDNHVLLDNLRTEGVGSLQLAECVTIKGHNAAVGLNTSTIPAIWTYNNDSAAEFSFNVSTVYDAYAYDDGGPSDDEGFLSVLL